MQCWCVALTDLFLSVQTQANPPLRIHHQDVRIMIVPLKNAQFRKHLIGVITRRLGQPPGEALDQQRPLHQFGSFLEPLPAPCRDLVRLEPGNGSEVLLRLLSGRRLLCTVEPHTSRTLPSGQWRFGVRPGRHGYRSGEQEMNTNRTNEWFRPGDHNIDSSWFRVSS